MAGKLNEPGILEIDWMDPSAGGSVYRVASGPWTYAGYLCFTHRETPDTTTYVPISNVKTWRKEAK
jgi:hypothetical protein